MTKKAGSGSESGSVSISQRHGSADPDPHQHVMDPEYWAISSNSRHMFGALQPIIPPADPCLQGTTGTQASFLQLFQGDHEKVKELDRKVLDIAVLYRHNFSKY
jgi:hypothetical protein